MRTFLQGLGAAAALFVIAGATTAYGQAGAPVRAT